MDGLRAIAALSVVAFHIGFVSRANVYSPIGKWTGHLNVGVTVFFVISGFLLYRPFVAMRFGAPGRSLRTYARNRALRILPAYWFSLTLLAIIPGLTGVFTGDWWRYYGLLQAYSRETVFLGNPVAWTLAIEVGFYAALPFYVVAMRRLRPGLRTELAILAAVSVAGLALNTLFDLPTLPGTFDWFAAGMALAVASVHGALPSRRAIAPASWLAAAVLFLAFPYLLRWWPTTDGAQDPYVWRNLLSMLIAVLVVLPAVVPATGTSLPQKVLATRTAAWLGLVSYGIYLFHLGVLVAVQERGWEDLIPGRTALSYALLALPITIALAALSYYVVERPALRLKTARRKTAAEPRPPRGGSAPGFAIAALQLGALWALALVQPLFDLLGRNAQFFVAHGNTGADILFFALGFVLVPPLLLAALETVVHRVRPQLVRPLHLLLVGLLVALIVLPPFGRLLDGSGIAVVLALIVGGAAAALYDRAAGVRSFVTVLSPAPLVFLLLFLVGSPVSKLVFPSDAASAAGIGRSSTPVVMIVLDELPVTSLMGPGGQIAADRFPNLARLAGDATWYRNATTVADGTTEAVPALLTGMKPRRGRLPTAADNPRSIFTLLGRSHELHVVEPITDVCPDRLCGTSKPGVVDRLRLLQHDLRIVEAHLLLPERLRGGLPPINQGWEGFGLGEDAKAPSGPQSAALLEQTLARLGQNNDAAGFEQIRNSIGPGGKKPGFWFIHATMPHAPWRFLPDGRQYVAHGNPLPGLENEQWTGPQWLVDQAFQRHVLQAEYTDKLVGGVLERLRATGQYDDAIVVVTADHGVSFRAGQPRRGPAKTNMPDIANVPLLVKAPRQQRPRVHDGAVRTIDVVPTVGKLLRTGLPWRVDGVPADERDDSDATSIDVTHSGVWTTRVPFGEVVRLRDERIRTQASLFGGSGSRDAVYEIGSRRGMVGKPASAFEVEPPSRGQRVVIDAPGDYANVVPDSGVVPAFVSGQVSGVPAGAEVAIAVDGRVRATTRVRREQRTPVFGALVPPEALPGGKHTIEVFRVLGPDRLRKLGEAPPG